MNRGKGPIPSFEGRTVQINLRNLPSAQAGSGLRSKRRGEVSFWDSSFGEVLIPSSKEGSLRP